jgi:DNA invertase Pin-like site-specific DNA recombinase
MPFVYGYCRVSSRDQAENGKSLLTQQETLRAHFEHQYKGQGDWEWGGIHQDAAVSASIPFFERTIGGVLDKRLKKGDVVVACRLDRMFRSMRDMCNTLHVWKTRGVCVKLLDINLDTDTAVGEMMLNMLGVFAQFFRRQLSERIKEGIHKGKARVDAARRPVLAPYGFRYTTDRNRRVMVRDDEERWWMGQIYDQHVHAGKSFWDIWQWIKSQNAKAREGRDWTLNRVSSCYKAEVKLRQQELVILHHKPKLDAHKAETRRAEGTFCGDSV